VRYAAGHKDETRKRILTAAARRFRQKGFRAAGIDDVMGSAGLTAGGFYAHFPSKQALLAEMLAVTLGQTREQLMAGLEQQQGAEWLRSVVGRYLSRTHRDQPEGGCALPALAADVGRAGRPARRALQSYIEQIAAELAPRTPSAPGLPPEDRVLATISLLVGALMLARAVPDAELSDRILRSARRLAVPETAEAATGKMPARTSAGEKR
jgi:TetR/AcrR family transcriptional regulator, transcriptional repressor for nem operon